MTKIYSAKNVAEALKWGPLIDAIDGLFRIGCTMPVRHHHGFGIPGETDGTLLLMPAWSEGAYLGVKMVSVVPGNSSRGLPAISGTYILTSAKTGELLAILDGAELTARRTAAASALAGRYLAGKDARHLLVVGTGTLSLNLIEAHSEIHPLDKISIWGRRPEQAAAVAKEAQARGHPTTAVTDLQATAATADIISCCTLSEKPLVLGSWLRPGTHVDLVGAFKPTMRETDDTAVLDASVFADTRDGVLSEGGDIVQPIKAGVITADHIRADLYELSRRTHPGRTSDDEITMFKSVGAALEDLAAAIVVHETLGG
ncbi:MAG: ornithine cyclodeaminase family protein [Roseibium sp.]